MHTSRCFEHHLAPHTVLVPLPGEQEVSYGGSIDIGAMPRQPAALVVASSGFVEVVFQVRGMPDVVIPMTFNMPILRFIVSRDVDNVRIDNPYQTTVRWWFEAIQGAGMEDRP
jgi:hypothetical protein